MSNEPCLFASRPSTLHRVNASVACGPRPGVGRWRPVHGRISGPRFTQSACLNLWGSAFAIDGAAGAEVGALSDNAACLG